MKPTSTNNMNMSDDMDTTTSRMDLNNDESIDGANMEKLWAKEQYEMSQVDREAASYELHGVESRYDAIEYENPEIQYQSLVKFENELKKPDPGIPSHLKRSFIRAMDMKSAYVSSSDFRLRFLRAEFFDIKKAVIRYCKCLNLLVDFFGDASLLRQIFLSDLTKSERKLLKEGGMQLSPSRDSLGRRTMFLIGNVGANYSPRERDRVGLYMLFQVLSEDETTQRNGLVTVHYFSEDVNRSMGGENTPRMSNLFLSIFEACPLRFSAIHMCFPNDFMYRFLKPLMLLLIGNKGRKVLVIHSGTTIECNYSLSSFGVRLDDIPITYSGTVKTRQHMRWIKVRVAMDQFIKQQCKENVDGDYRFFYASDHYTVQPFPHIQCPEINCVLFHKNGVAWEFPGNIKFRAFLDDQLQTINCYQNMYSSYSNARNNGISCTLGDPHEKEGVFDRIIRLSLAQNFQFLLHDETKHWYIKLKDPNVLRRYIGFTIRGRQRRVSAQRDRRSCSDKNTRNNANNIKDGSNQRTGPVNFRNMDGRQQNCGPDVCFGTMR